MGNTKIVVLRSREVLYTLLFLVLGVLLLALFFFMFLPSMKSEEIEETASYIPGIYNSQLNLNDTTLNIEVVVDENHINSVRLVNIDESIATMYPLMEPAMESISEQLCKENVAIDDIVLSDSSKYTQTMLLQAVEETLKKAAVE